MTLADFNAADRDRFVGLVGWVFENSPWVADRAWEQRPFASLTALHQAMTTVVDNATAAEQLALLRAHPDLGARARMSEASIGEQSGAGLDQLTADELERLHTLNTAYHERFGFPFLYAVKGSSKDDILAALETRLAGTPVEEFREALSQVYRIARFRLETIIQT